MSFVILYYWVWSCVVVVTVFDSCNDILGFWMRVVMFAAPARGMVLRFLLD